MMKNKKRAMEVKKVKNIKIVKKVTLMKPLNINSRKDRLTKQTACDGPT